MEQYLKFINQHADANAKGFKVIDNELWFHGVNLMEIIEIHGTPLKFTYLPVISNRIKSMKRLFRSAMASANYNAQYIYCYCTKSSHFNYVINEALDNNIGLEISSAFDIPLISSLISSGKLDRSTPIICNGFKTEPYKRGIADLMDNGYNITPILDNKEELTYYVENIKHGINIGMRVASEDRPVSQFYTSRLGIRKEEVIDLFKQKISGTVIKLTTLHFFVDSGISDTNFYWEELDKNVELFCRLKQLNPDLTRLDIGGGMPFMDSFQFDFNYKKLVSEIIRRIKKICLKNKVQEPDIITEFGKYTVSESSGILYKVLARKQQNHKEKWLMLDGSFITNLPDTWAIGQKYLLLPINNLNAQHEHVYLGGMTCDGDDYYKTGESPVRLPRTRKTQYLGFFHTGAYQDVLSGYGGIHHCLLPSPKQIIVSRNFDGTLSYRVFAEEQNSKQALKILGY